MKENNMKIPDGWEEKTLNELCIISKGVQLNKLELENSGLFPCINGGISASGYTDKWNRNANTITISEGGNSCGFVNLIATKFWSGGHCYSLLELKNIITNNFLYHALKGRERSLMDLRVGSGLPNIQQKAIKEFKIIFPKSLAEQKKIAEILSTIDKAIDQTQSLIAKYQRIKTGLMQDLLTKGIDENGNIRSEETHEFKDSELGRIPKEWECDKLDRFLYQKQYGVSIPLVERGITPVLRMNNIKFGELFLEEIKYSKYALDAQFLLKDKDILFNRTNSIEHVGRTGIFREQNIDYSFASYLVRLVPNGDVNPEYLNLLMNYNVSQNRIKSIATFAVHQANVNPTNLGNLFFSFPKRDEQDRILATLNKINIQIVQGRKSLTKLQSIKTGLMQDLLSGKKRVTNLII